MALLSITPKIRRDYGDTAPLDSQSVVPRTRLHYDLVFDVGTSDDEIKNDLRVPQPKQLLGPGQFLRVVERDVSRSSQIMGELAVQYESPALGLATHNPLDVRPHVRGTTIATEVEIDTDIDGNAILTVTKEKFDPLPRATVRIPLLHVERNVAFDPSAVIAQYMCSPLPATNSDLFRGTPVGALTVWDMSFEEVFADDYVFYKFVVEFARRDAAPGSTVDKAWWLRVLAQGYLVSVLLPVAGFAPAHIDGVPVIKPVRHAVATGDILDFFDPDEWYEFNIRPSLPFYSIGILNPGE